MVQRSTGIEILIPDMGTEHTYRAGEWLGERVLASGTYFLSGVVPENGLCNEKQNVIVQSCQPVVSPSSLYARIIMPRPHCFHHLGQVPLREDADLHVDSSITIKGHTAGTPYTLSTLQVLKYAIVDNDPKNVRLGCHEFTKSAQEFGDDFYMSLHIFAAPDGPEIGTHAQGGFATVVAMGEGLAKKIFLNSVVPVPDPSAVQPPAGLIKAELRSLSRRVETLTYLGRWLRQFQDASTTPISLFEGVDGDIVTCTEIILDTGD
jgi:hypothetical protein